jgi:glycine oxidase
VSAAAGNGAARAPWPERVEVAVVGGGVIGLATALELAHRGRRVALLDRGEKTGVATWASAGMLAPAAEAEVHHEAWTDLRRASFDLYPEFVARLEAESGVDCGFRRAPSLHVALEARHESELERLRATLAEQGLAARALGAAEARELEPALGPRVLAALLVEGEGYVNPRALTEALRRALRKHGGGVIDGALVTRVGEDGWVGGLLVPERTAFELRAQAVVIAAGSWSGGELDSPARGLPLRPVRGQAVRLQGNLVRHVVRTPDAYLVPHASGEMVVGATSEEQGFDATPTAGAVMDLLRHAWRAAPAIYEQPWVEVSVGFRPAARDHLPVMGPMAGAVHVATGHFRNGILLAPVTARLVSDALGGAEPELLRGFAPQRFAAAAAEPVAAGRPR